MHSSALRPRIAARFWTSRRTGPVARRTCSKRMSGWSARLPLSMALTWANTWSSRAALRCRKPTGSSVDFPRMSTSPMTSARLPPTSWATSARPCRRPGVRKSAGRARSASACPSGWWERRSRPSRMRWPARDWRRRSASKTTSCSSITRRRRPVRDMSRRA